MENFCFSIDEERYDDRHGHVLSLDGWYAHPERKVYEFELLGDGYDTVELPQIQRENDRMSHRHLAVNSGDFLPGFTVRIPEVLKLAEKYQSLELFLRHDEERISIWEINAEELDELIKENLVEYHLDRVEILYDTMLEIQGWVVDQRGSVDVTVHQEDASLLDCRISRGRRPDVVERRNLDEEYKMQEIDSAYQRHFRKSKEERSFFISAVILLQKHIILILKHSEKKISRRDSLADSLEKKLWLRVVMKCGSHGIKQISGYSAGRSMLLLHRNR